MEVQNQRQFLREPRCLHPWPIALLISSETNLNDSGTCCVLRRACPFLRSSITAAIDQKAPAARNGRSFSCRIKRDKTTFFSRATPTRPLFHAGDGAGSPYQRTPGSPCGSARCGHRLPFSTHGPPGRSTIPFSGCRWSPVPGSASRSGWGAIGARSPDLSLPDR